MLNQRSIDATQIVLCRLGYDNADQLTTAPLKNASTNALIKQFTYGYDTASNRTSETVATTTTTSTPKDF